LAFEIFKESYTGNIRDITLGKGDAAVHVGGDTSYPFYLYEGDMPNKPKVAMEVWDMEPEDWPEAAVAPFKEVIADPAAWAKKCVEDYGAELIVLQLKSTDPNGKNASAAQAVETVKKVAAAAKVPLVVWGTANVQKDEEVLKKVSEECQGMNLVLGPVEDKNHKGIGASAMGFGHTVIASSPIDVNLAKQLNILLENLGVPTGRIIVDPTTGGLGYGLEYSYSVMERLSMAALTQGDDKLQLPIINNLGNEIWKCKEAKESAESAPTLGDPEKRGVLMEAVAAVCYLLSGSNVLIVRHPETVRLVKTFIDLCSEGGSSLEVAPVKKLLPSAEVDLAALAPAPDLSVAEEAPKAAKPAAPAAPKAEAPKTAPAKAEVKPVAKPEPKVDTEAAAKAKAEADAKAKAEADAKAKAEADAKAKTEADAKAKAEAEAKAKTEADAKAKAEAQAKAKAEADAKAKAEERAKREAEEDALRAKRSKEREERAGERKAAPKKEVRMTPAAEQKTSLDKLIGNLDRVHRR